MWEGGLAYFGGLAGGIAAAWGYATRHRVRFGKLADLFAPAVPIGSAIGRISCFLDGMDYGTPTRVPWGVVYLNSSSYAPNDGTHAFRFVLFFVRGNVPVIAWGLTVIWARRPQHAS